MKKKGLIISTVVMAVVLVCALTTATYAWFNSTGKVSIDNMQITTTAAEGLQISVLTNVTNEEHQSGALTWDATTSQVLGDEKSWGSTLTFTDITSTPNATTRGGFTAFSGTYAAYKYYTKATVSGVDYYILQTGSTAPSGEDLYQFTANESSGTMYVPSEVTVSETQYTAYVSGTTTPQVLTAATNLTNYFNIPIQVQATSANITQIYYRIKVVQVPGTISANYKPGMAAASRIAITTGLASSTPNTIVKEPYSNAVQSGSAFVKSGTSNTFTEADVYSWDGFIYNGCTGTDTTFNAADVAPYTAYSFGLCIWLEGTDAQCINAVSGSGFQILVEIGYTKAAAEADAATLKNGILSDKATFSASMAVGTQQI